MQFTPISSDQRNSRIHCSCKFEKPTFNINRNFFLVINTKHKLAFECLQWARHNLNTVYMNLILKTTTLSEYLLRLFYRWRNWGLEIKTSDQENTSNHLGRMRISFLFCETLIRISAFKYFLMEWQTLFTPCGCQIYMAAPQSGDSYGLSG